ncbi:MAG: FAD:protein FMN transferase [Chloroflexales bacterium]|nr:FAD:protein FMN transferase [Chloroflexales bacterium]
MTKPFVHEWRALGVLCRVVSNSPLDTVAIESQVEEWEQALSRFRPNSDLSRLNRQRHAHVSAPLQQVLLAALEVAQWSQGLVVPSLGQHIADIGYDQNFATVAPVTAAVVDAAIVPDWRRIVVRGRDVTIPPQMKLDLAGVAKGWIAEQLVALFTPPGGSLLAQIGGDVSVSAPSDTVPWCIAVDHPLQSTSCGNIALFEGTVATSSTYERRWQRAGQTIHHIIDPRSGMPAQSDVLTASVIATQAIYAEAAAKIIVVLGSAAGLAWVSRYALPALIIDQSGNVRTNDAWVPFIWSEGTTTDV